VMPGGFLILDTYAENRRLFDASCAENNLTRACRLASSRWDTERLADLLADVRHRHPGSARRAGLWAPRGSRSRPTNKLL